MVSCLIALDCGESAAYEAGLLKELRDIKQCIQTRQPRTCNSAWQKTDFFDNQVGIKCPKTRKCEDHCESYTVMGDGPPDRSRTGAANNSNARRRRKTWEPTERHLGVIAMSLCAITMACALLTGCESDVTDLEVREYQTALGRVRRVGNGGVFLDLAPGVTLTSAVDMQVFAKTAPEMTYDDARAAFGEPIGSRRDSYDVTWHKFVVPSGYAEVGLEKAGSDNVVTVGWRLYVYPDEQRAPLMKTVREKARPLVEKLSSTRAEIFINSREEQQQVWLEVKGERITRALWRRHEMRF